MRIQRHPTRQTGNPRGSSAANLQQQINDLKARIAFYNACKPPRIKAATVCTMKLHDLIVKQLKREIKPERRAS